MRNIKTRIKSSQIDLCPWQFPDNIESQRRQQDTFTSFTICHQTPFHHKISHSLQTTTIDHTHSPSKIYRKQIETKLFHGRTLTFIKDYFKKYYTQESEEHKMTEKDILVQTKKKFDACQLTRYENRSIKKTSIVDLTPALENCIVRPNKNMASHKDYPGSKILKIKQEMIRNKQRKKIDQRQLQIVEGFRPESKTLPVRVLLRQGASLKKSHCFPDKNFGRLLQEYLEKV